MSLMWILTRPSTCCWNRLWSKKQNRTTFVPRVDPQRSTLLHTIATLVQPTLFDSLETYLHNIKGSPYQLPALVWCILCSFIPSFLAPQRERHDSLLASLGGWLEPTPRNLWQRRDVNTIAQSHKPVRGIRIRIGVSGCGHPTKEVGQTGGRTSCLGIP